MPESCQIVIFDQKTEVFSKVISGPIEFGRQREADERLFEETTAGRMAIARREEQTIPRRYFTIAPRSAGRLRIENLTTNRSVRLEGEAEIPPSSFRDVELPVRILFGVGKVLRAQAYQPQHSLSNELRSLPQMTLAPGSSSILESPLGILSGDRDEEVGRSVISWLQASMGVFQAAASSSDFFDKAAQAVVDIVGLDSGSVLLWRDGGWDRQACYVPPPGSCSSDAVPSRRVLNMVRQERRTLWELPDIGGSGLGMGSLKQVEAVVASPILNKQGEVIGAIYGDRRKASSGMHVPTVTELEAMLVELVSRAVAAGLARLDQEQAALREKVQFEQFFTPELARQLAAQPDLLEGRDCDVTVLFCDIRGFSRISERLGPAKTVQWIHDVMGALSDCVLSHKGVLVDYIGDELMAMWGAPEQDPHHAELACKAGIDMLRKVPKLNARWSQELGEPMDLGIGINSGKARVGNTGSKHKFKYGPLGNTVNLASRVQGATKYLRARLLITGATQAHLSEELSTRRLCRVRVVNIAEPVALYELGSGGQGSWSELKRSYEKALDEFDCGNLRVSAQIAANILVSYPDDGPTIVLLSRAAQSLAHSGEKFDPIWELPGK